MAIKNNGQKRMVKKKCPYGFPGTTRSGAEVCGRKSLSHFKSKDGLKPCLSHVPVCLMPCVMSRSWLTQRSECAPCVGGLRDDMCIIPWVALIGPQATCLQPKKQVKKVGSKKMHSNNPSNEAGWFISPCFEQRLKTLLFLVAKNLLILLSQLTTQVLGKKTSR